MKARLTNIETQRTQRLWTVDCGLLTIFLLIGPPLHALTWNAVPCDHYEVQSSPDVKMWTPCDYPTNNMSPLVFNQPQQFYRVRAWRNIECSDWATVATNQPATSPLSTNQ